MTGYGKAEATIGNFEITIEVKSVNNRYLDISFRAPSFLLMFESELRDLIKTNVNRGKIIIFIDIKGKLNPENGNSVNEEKLLSLYNTLNSIKEKLNIPDKIELSHLLQFQDLFEADISTLDEDQLLEALKTGLSKALKAFNTMRGKEGAHLIDEMTSRLETITKTLSEVRQLSNGTVRSVFDKLSKRVNDLLENKAIDRDRLEQEIALISDKVDITEELTRFESHITQFHHSLKRDSEVGKKITFILQEMHREANTINSKTTEVDIAHRIIEIKEDIEKIREQAQNIE